MNLKKRELKEREQKVEERPSPRPQESQEERIESQGREGKADSLRALESQEERIERYVTP